MNQMAKMKVQELVDETGHQLSVDDLDDINRLNQAGEEVKGIDDAVIWQLLERPITVGNIILHPLTIGAYCWMVEMIQRAELEKPEMGNVVIAYAMVYSKEPKKLMAVLESSHPWRKLFLWSLTVHTTSAKLERAFTKMLPGCDEGDEQSTECSSCKAKIKKPVKPIESTYGSMIAFLTKEIGATPRYWLWEESIEVANGYLNDAVEKYHEQIRQAEKASSKAGHSKVTVSDSTMIALKKFREISNELRDKWLNIK